MRIFKDVKLVEHLGTGIRRILRVYDKNIFEFYPNFLRVTFKFNENQFKKVKKINKTSEKFGIDRLILNQIETNSNITIKELSEIIKVTERTISRYINELILNSRIKRVGSKKNGYWKIINK